MAHSSGVSATDRADTFSRYLDVLGSCLEDPEASGEDLAARAYLSRYHFDRMAGAALGEPPGAFRRRLLLERAAHALATGSSTVLDVAVEAGYGSHEAFTRAFTRAYGVGPAAWRRSEVYRLGRGLFRDFELPAPSDVHYQPPQGLRIPAPEKVSEMELLQPMVDHHVRTIEAIIARCDELEEKVLDAEVDFPMEWVDEAPVSLRGLVANLVVQEERWLSEVRGEQMADRRDTSLAGLRARHESAGPAYREFVRATIAGGRLADTFVMTDCQPPQVVTFGGVIMHVVTFGAVRRTVTLRVLAKASGRDDLGWGDPMHLLDPTS